MKRHELYPETVKYLIYILDEKNRATFREVQSLSTEFQKDLIAIIAEDIFHFDGIKQEKLSAIEKLVEEKAFPGQFKPQFKAFVRICNRTVYPSWYGTIYEKDIEKFKETLFSNDRIYLLDINIMIKVHWGCFTQNILDIYSGYFLFYQIILYWDYYNCLFMRMFFIIEKYVYQTIIKKYLYLINIGHGL